MTSKKPSITKKPRTVATASLPVPAISLRSCGCVRRFVPTPPQLSQSAPVLARSRSSTRSSSSRSAVSSGRDTPTSCPSPSPATRPNSGLKHRAKSESHLPDLYPSSDPPRVPSKKTTEPRAVHFATTLLIRIGNDRRHFLEQVKYEMRYEPRLPREDEPQDFRTELDIQLKDLSTAGDSKINQT